jgi:quercetin dioxygenase-like cupin family protein
LIKLSPTQVPEDRSLGSVSGWVGMSVRWLFTDETVESRALTLNVTTFEPGGAHELHRHAGCEEVLYLLEGSGLHLTDSGERAIAAGEVAYIPASEWHGFRNDGDVPARVLCCYGGVASLDAAGYELLQGSDR